MDFISLYLSIIPNAGWLNAKHIEQRTIFAIIQYAVNSVETPIRLFVIRTIGLR